MWNENIIVVIFEKYHLSQMVTNEAHCRELETNSFEWKEKAIKMIVVSCFKAWWEQAMEIPDTAEGQSAEVLKTGPIFLRRICTPRFLPIHLQSETTLLYLGSVEKRPIGIIEWDSTSRSSLGNQWSITVLTEPKLVIKWKFAFPKYENLWSLYQ